MPPHVKRMVASLLICVFVIVWILLVVSVSGFIPDNRIAELVFYAVAGLGWAFPIMPVLSWMERDKKRAAEDR